MIGEANARVRRFSERDWAKRDMKCEQGKRRKKEAQKQALSYAGSNPPTIGSTRLRPFKMELDTVDCMGEF
jgi:hypothetical protein